MSGTEATSSLRVERSMRLFLTRGVVAIAGPWSSPVSDSLTVGVGVLLVASSAN